MIKSYQAVTLAVCPVSQLQLASHAFSARTFRDHVSAVFGRKLALLDAKLSAAAAAGQSIDLAACFFQFTLDSFCEIGFGTDVGALRSKVCWFDVV